MDKTAPKTASKKKRKKKSFKWKVAAYVGTIAGLAIAGFVSNFFGVLGSRAASESISPGQPSGPPVQVVVGNVSTAGSSEVLAQPVALTSAQLSALNNEIGAPNSDEAKWFASRRAAFLNGVEIELVVQGNRRNPVRIINISPVETCSAPLDGTMFYAPSAGVEGGSYLTLSTDNPLAPADFQPGLGSPTVSNFFGHYSVSLRYGEQYTFHIAVTGHKHYCQFAFDLTVLDGSGTVVESVNDHGQPFRLTGPSSVSSTAAPFSGYQDLYYGGVQSTKSNKFGAGELIRADPRTYNLISPAG